MRNSKPKGLEFFPRVQKFKFHFCDECLTHWRLDTLNIAILKWNVWETHLSMHYYFHSGYSTAWKPQIIFPKHWKLWVRFHFTRMVQHILGLNLVLYILYVLQEFWLLCLSSSNSTHLSLCCTNFVNSVESAHHIQIVGLQVTLPATPKDCTTLPSQFTQVFWYMTQPQNDKHVHQSQQCALHQFQHHQEWTSDFPRNVRTIQTPQMVR